MRLTYGKTTKLVLLFSAALVLRLSCMILLESYLLRSEWAFGFEYGSIARWVAKGEGFSSPYLDYPKPSAIAAPGYVYFIAFIFSIFGIYSTASAVVIQVVQSLAAAATCVMFYLLGERIFDERVGLLSATVLVFYPPSIFFSIMRIGPVILDVLLLAAIIYLLINIHEKRSYSTTVTCGILMGLVALIEPAVLPFFPLVCGWIFFRRDLSTVTAIKHVLTLGCIVVLCVIPWTIRNYVVFHKLVLIKSPLGMNLLYGNNPHGNGVVAYSKDLFSPEESQKLVHLDEITQDKLRTEKAINYIRENPGIFIKRTLRRVYAFWGFTGGYRETRFDLLRNVSYGIVLILSCIGTVLAYQQRKMKHIAPFLLFFSSYPIIFYITHVTFYRFRYPVEPFLILLASYAVVALLQRAQSWASWCNVASSQKERETRPTCSSKNWIIDGREHPDKVDLKKADITVAFNTNKNPVAQIAYSLFYFFPVSFFFSFVFRGALGASWPRCSLSMEEIFPSLHLQ